LGRVIEVLCTLFFVRIWQPAACGILFVNNHKTETDREPRFLFKKPNANPKMETVTALAMKFVEDSISLHFRVRYFTAENL